MSLNRLTHYKGGLKLREKKELDRGGRRGRETGERGGERKMADGKVYTDTEEACRRWRRVLGN